MKIAVVGSYGAGLTMRVPRAPVAGETLSGGRFASGHGGKGSNQAVAAARLGAEVSFLTAIGRDQFGDAARRLWHDEGVDASAVRTTDAATMVGFILVDDGGENRIAIAPGALDELTPADVDRFTDRIAEADLVVVSLEIPLPVALAALRTARAHGVRTLLNPAPAVALPDEAWEWIDVLTPNASEARVLTGLDPTDVASAGDVVELLRARYSGTVVLTLGADGALVDSGGHQTRVAPVTAPRVVDTTGAGDAFTAALAVALTRGDDLIEAVRYAAAAGTHAVGIAEVIPALPGPDDVAALLRR
ncbi:MULTISPECIES: ribokinase [unclassified Micromonospora]|uniref:ribokinase n=1 Tax=unclassified Micromonospora TaxID=2617518 RepID=UPI0022B5F167|nr:MULTISPECIES: ribokinase [unclassified Micromonospora]MCZ7418443.1 ribokinase [Verrucosispora sp. WMMA2121]WBB92168.1 ribokinase [Verrucosispora sp. WMMC514]